MAVNASHHRSSVQPIEDRIGWFSLPAMRYPSQYVWLVFLSAMDVIFTAIILTMGGSEVNPVALQIIEHWGISGAMAFKFALTTLAIIMCELVGRRQDVKGRWLTHVLVFIAAIPVAWSFLLLTTGGDASVLETALRALSEI